MILNLIIIISILCWYSNVQGLSITCPNNQYLDGAMLTCNSCGSNQVYNIANQTCTCIAGYYLAGSSCVSCSPGQTSSFDRTACLNCPAGTSTSPGTGAVTCQCGTNQFFIDRNSTSGAVLTTGMCSNCPYASYPSNDTSSCVSCSSTQYISLYNNGTGAYSCQCPNPFVSSPYAGFCITSSAISTVQTAYSVTQAANTAFGSVQTAANTVSQVAVSSMYIGNEFVGAAALCSTSALAETEACAALANLCVLQTYDQSTPACSAYANVAKGRGASPSSTFTDWPNEMPWLYYGLLNSQTASTALAQPVNVFVTFAANPSPPEVNSIPIYLATYTLNGTYLGLRLLSTEVNFCAGSGQSVDLLMGNNMAEQCSIELAAFNNPQSTLFYDPYILQADGSLYPVPVRITNYKPSQNSNSAPASSYQLVRRFVLIDTISSSAGADGTRPSVVSYAASLSLLVTKQTDVSGKILVPQLSITYAQRDVNALGWNSSVAPLPVFTFSASYVMNYDTFWRVIAILFAIVCVLAVIIWLYVSYSWNRRNYLPIETMDIPFLCNVMFTGAGAFATFFFVLLYGISLYWLIFYKGQTVVYVVLPTDTNGSEISSFNALVVASFCLQASYLVLRLYRQCRASFFFIDWERPRHLLAAGNGVPLSTVPALAQAAEPSSLPAQSNNLPSAKYAAVSMWRTLKMINRWRELQTYRKVNTNWTLFWMVFILIGCKVRYVATAQPNASDLSVASTNPILLFGINTSVWLGLVLLQLLFKYAIYERFVHHALLSFVDSLSIANISLIVFSDRFHGYYVHGKSVHGFADVDMSTMNDNLLKEEHDQVALRGLAGTSDQVYEVFVTKQFNELYSKVNMLVVSREDRKRLRMIAHMSKQAQPRKPIASNSEALRAAESVNKFLCSLIDKNFKDYTYNIRQRIWSEKYLSLFPDLSQGSIFYTEQSPVFSEVLFCGTEYVFLVFLILAYNLVDCYADNPALATLITFLFDFVIIQARSFFGQRNISQRTLVDSKYLF